MKPGLILISSCVRHTHAAPFLRNKISDSPIRPPKTHAFLGGGGGMYHSKCPTFGKMRGEIHNCALLLYALALFWLYRTHALIFYNKPWKQRLESEVQGLECINSFAAMLFIVNTVYLNDRYREKQSIHQLLKGIYSILRKR